ncbi:uncharacterized protein LOC116171146 [Photinus pyralis]|uniref:uncharacterized protein LOC116171146 n=1 Tax=Photinus pyralis TaxID=7054 RepID=UPI001266EAAA|nr:uncharacterized protein LOC116171146 [Photinus pyralis]
MGSPVEIESRPASSLDTPQIASVSNMGSLNDILPLPQPEMTEKQESLSENILALLGETSSATNIGTAIHPEVAVRWNRILKDGLSDDVRKGLLQKYPPLANVTNVPKLNLEVRGALSEAAVQRDERLILKQQQISSCIAALGPLVSHFLEGIDTNNSLLETASDAGRLLADLFHSESMSRKILSSSGLNNKLRNTVLSGSNDEWLFGTDLGERIKSAKVLERSSAELKTKTPSAKPSTSYNLNSKRPSFFPPRRIQKVPFKQDGRRQASQKGHLPRSSGRNYRRPYKKDDAKKY